MTPATTVSPEWLQYGSFGLLAVILIYTLIYVAPKIVNAVESIAPTIRAELKEQNESHRKWVDDVTEKHRDERREMMVAFRDSVKDVVSKGRN